MRVYVGVLYSGENEFESCIKAIEGQDYANWQLHVIKRLPGREAHDVLYTNFLESGCDVLIKIDSDMVLMGNNFFSFVEDTLVNNMKLRLVQFPVFDFFSSQPIWGLNIYNKNFFDDIAVQINRGLSFEGELHACHQAQVLTVVATHCQNPTLFQSFHYGAFKVVKIVQAEKYGMGKKVKYFQDILNKTYQAFLKTGDERRAVCIAGARLAVAKKLGFEDLDYTNPRLLNYFNQIQDYQGKENLCL